MLRVVVYDESMLPTLAPGDRLLAIARADRPLRAGDVIVLRSPENPARKLVKRVIGFQSDGRLEVRGDNAARSRDSRAFGPVPTDAVLGVVWYRYLPGSRRGLLGRDRPGSITAPR